MLRSRKLADAQVLRLLLSQQTQRCNLQQRHHGRPSALLEDIRGTQTKILDRLGKIEECQQANEAQLAGLTRRVEPMHHYLHRNAGLRVMNVTELPEQILVFLGNPDEGCNDRAECMRDLLPAQGVSKRFPAVIKGSAKIRKLLFLEADNGKNVKKLKNRLAIYCDAVTYSDRRPYASGQLFRFGTPHVVDMSASVQSNGAGDHLHLRLQAEPVWIYRPCDSCMLHLGETTPPFAAIICDRCYARQQEQDATNGTGAGTDESWKYMLMVRRSVKIAWEADQSCGMQNFAQGEFPGGLFVAEAFQLDQLHTESELSVLGD